MTAVFLGLLAAVCWGGADVLARHTGRALGAQGALLAMMLAGMTGLGAWITLAEHRLPGWPCGLTLLSASLAAVAMLTFYEAMKRGPVSLVSPLVGAYPVWIVLINLAQGLHPGWPVLTAMVTIIAGMVLVARFAAEEPDPDEAPNRLITLLLALFSSVVFAVTLLFGQQAVLSDGETTVLWWGRAIGAVTMIIVVLASPRPKQPSGGAVALAALQGVLDAGGLCALYAAGRGLDGALATVASSAFGVVTVLLARLLYRERITAPQGLGVAAVSAGVCALAWLA